MQYLREKPQRGARLNLSHPLSKGLVGCWLMNDQGRRVFDYSPYNNHGTAIGFTDPIHTLGQQSSNGITFDGVDDYVDAGNNASLNLTTQNFTISGWVNRSALGAQYFIEKRNGASGAMIRLEFSSTNKMQLNLFDGSNNPVSISTTTITISNWVHFSGVLDRNTHRVYIYINGILEGNSSDAGLGSVGNAGNWWIGKGNGVNLLKGIMDEVRIYNRALSASEVKQLYLNPYQMFME